jgi:hypothetical protein
MANSTLDFVTREAKASSKTTVLRCTGIARRLNRATHIRQLQMDRISVDELRALIDEGQKLLILDVDDSAPAARHATWQITASRPPGEARGIDSTDARVALDCRRLV